MNIDTFQDLTGVITSFLGLLATGLLAAAIPVGVAYTTSWLRVRSSEIKQRLSREQLEMIQTVGTLVVRAAEQKGASGSLDDGSAKRNYATGLARDYLHRLGLKLDSNAIVGLIEAEVIRQFRSVTPTSEISQARSALIDQAIQTAVLAAEQSAVKRKAIDDGLDLAEQKKKYALALASIYIAEYGLQVAPDLIDGMIEAQLTRFRMEAARAVSR